MSTEEKENTRISRRKLLRAAVTVAPAAVLVPLAPGIAGAQPQVQSPQPTGPYKPRIFKTHHGEEKPAAPYEPKVFNAHQWKTVRVLSDLIIPADDRSGSATQAGVPEFIDDWLHIKGRRLGTETLGILMWLDLESNRAFTHDFVDCSVAQQKQLLDRIAYPATAAPEDANAVAAFNHLRDLVLGGFYSSKIGIEDLQYQGNKMLESWNGCPENVTSRLGVDYSDWKHWNQNT